MNKTLEALIKIKTFRKNRAEIEVSLQQQNVLHAVTALQAAEAELERYIAESTQKEKMLFQKILNQQVKLRKIEDMQHKVSLLREGVVAREESKREAHSELDLYQNRLHQAQKNYQETVRIEEKFLTLSRIDDQATLREAERLSDLELEELPMTMRNIDEWEYQDE